MRILQLNAWTGRIKGNILKFIREGNYDIICLQEAVWSETEPEQLENFAASVDQMKEVSGLQYEFRSANWGMKLLDGKMEQGNAILSRYPMLEKEEIWIRGEYKGDVEIKHADKWDQGYTAQKVLLENGLIVVNYHGYWLPDPLGDEETVAAMKKVADAIRGVDGPMVMCGDLNVVHESPAMREIDFLRDLTDEYEVDNTLVGLKFNGKVACDHILVNEKVEVRSFEVKSEIVSDHKALEAELFIL